MQVFSKLVFDTCQNVHVYSNTCSQDCIFMLLVVALRSSRIYSLAYICTLLMKGRVPTKDDLRKTLLGILQSTAFLSFTGFGYSLFLCSLRRLLGHFNIVTASGLPAFLASVLAIQIERPSRRTLLCLYVSNVATETVWNMALSRGMVRNIQFGDVAIFGGSMALLLAYFKGGYHKDSSDSMFRILKFVVGPYEEKDFAARSSQASTFYRQQVASNNNPNEGRAGSSGGSSTWKQSRGPKRVLFIVNQMLRIYKKMIYKIKCCDKHSSCPHPFSCLYYVIQGSAKMFSVGLGIQLTLKLVLNLKRIIQSPKNMRSIFFRKDILNLGIFLGAYSGVFRGSLCALRRLFGKDDPRFAIPAGLLAGLAFMKYPDTTLSLYVLWKAAQITYSLGIQKGYVPKVPGFTEFLYCLSTAILFHAAILEPTNLRPSYWKFLHSISGGRIACMNRQPLDALGLNTSESLAKVLKSTRTIPVVLF